MSAVDDKSNQDSRKGGARRGNTQNDRPAGQQRQTQAQAQNVARENSNTQSRKGGKTGPSAPANNKTVDATTTPPILPTPNEHVPLNDFNSIEVDILLRKAVDQKIPIYKPEAQNPQAKAQSPWGAKRSMSNGRDFFLELRKQVTNLQQSGGVSQGG